MVSLPLGNLVLMIVLSSCLMLKRKKKNPGVPVNGMSVFCAHMDQSTLASPCKAWRYIYMQGNIPNGATFLFSLKIVYYYRSSSI